MMPSLFAPFSLPARWREKGRPYAQGASIWQGASCNKKTNFYFISIFECYNL
jgi:hypothetical protein